ncbi:MAG: DUF2914 domain-containing protein [Caldithrix sp.]|nr:DUF2914 domain-containing protein [Caldithrix sp.]
MNKLSDTVSTRLEAVKLVYSRHHKWVPVVSFVAGFTWDTLTLTRIDLFIDNLILFVYLAMLALTITIQNLLQYEKINVPRIKKYEHWLPIIIQFFIGGLFSSYVVFYFQSASLSKDWLFLGLLLIVFVGNEFIESKLTSLKFQFVLFFLAAFSFFIFFIPIVLKHMNSWVFTLSGLVTMAFAGGLLYLIYKLADAKDNRHFQKLAGILAILFIVVNLLYHLNWIPPVPLSVKDSGIYNHVQRVGQQYVLKYQKGAWYQLFKDSTEEYQYSAGDSVFCFAAVFAPTHLDKGIVHHWQYYNTKTDQWQTTDRLDYVVQGGRDGGYRGYTYKTNIMPGRWRVDIQTDHQKLLSRLNFTVVKTNHRSLELKTIYR